MSIELTSRQGIRQVSSRPFESLQMANGLELIVDPSDAPKRKLLIEYYE